MSNIGIASSQITGRSTSGGGGSSNSTLAVTQTTHGFSVGQAIYYTGTAWALASSNSASTLGIGLVTIVPDANNFTVMFEGVATGLSGLVAGNYYFVSDSTPGLLTSSEPTNINSYSNPIFFAISTTSGIVLPFRPSVTISNSGVVGGGSGSSANPINPDTYPASPSAANDEFDTGTSIDLAGTRVVGGTPWVWRNQGASTATINFGFLQLKAPASASTNLRIVEQATSGSVWKYRTKLRKFGSDTNFDTAAMCVVNSSTGKVILWGFNYSTGNTMEGVRYTNVTTLTSSVTGGAFAYLTETRQSASPFMYLELESDGTTLFLRYSYDGVDFIQKATETIAGFIGSIDRIGLVANSENSNDTYAVVDWFRRVDGAYNPTGVTFNQFALSPDSHPLLANAINDEFESSTLNAKWTIQNNTGNTNDINTTVPGSLLVKLNASATPAPIYTISQPIAPGGADVAVTVKVSMFPTTNFHSVSFYLADTIAVTNGVIVGWGLDAAVVHAFMHKRVAGVQTNDIAVSPTFTAGTQDQIYLHLQRKSGAWTFWYSLNGMTWSPMTITGFPAFTINFLLLEIASYSTTAAACMGAIDFVRMNAFFL